MSGDREGADRRAANHREVGPSEGPVRRLDATVVGVVQGVGFRWFVAERARELGLVGWVANQPDGSVRCVVEGPERALDGLMLALREGPAASRVESVAELRSAPTGGFVTFAIRSGAHRGD